MSISKADQITTFVRLEAQCRHASAARLALPSGSSRAKVTTANARWIRLAAERDRWAEKLHPDTVTALRRELDEEVSDG